MTITAHVVVGGVLVLEKLYAPPTWVQLAIWTPVLILLSLWLLPRIKGALIGYQWALKMHGFGNTAFDDPELGFRAANPNLGSGRTLGSLSDLLSSAHDTQSLRAAITAQNVRRISPYTRPCLRLSAHPDLLNDLVATLTR